MFLLPEHSKQLSKNGSKTAQYRLPKPSYNFSIFFPGPGPPKAPPSSWRAYRYTHTGIAGICWSYGGRTAIPGICLVSFLSWVLVLYCYGNVGMSPRALDVVPILNLGAWFSWVVQEPCDFNQNAAADVFLNLFVWTWGKKPSLYPLVI